MIGAWLFRNRGWLPVPLVLGMFIAPVRHLGAGLALIAAGEALRIWAVGHIGLPSRTRDATTPGVVRDGPYGWVRNPLYLGNLLLFAGLGVVLWPSVFVAVPLLMVHYHLIVGWEEKNLTLLLGEPYRRYLDEVPRWWPRFGALTGTWRAAAVVRSERSTLAVIAVVLAGLYIRG